MVDITFGHGRAKIAGIVDIAVGGVSISIVELHGGACTVLATAHSALAADARTPDQSVGILAQQIKEAGDLALQTYVDYKRTGAIETVYAIVHAPWARSQMVQGSRRFAEDTQVEEDTIASLAKESLAQATGIDMGRLFEASMTRIEIDGYPTSSPEGKRVRTLDTFSLVSDCDPQVKSLASGALGALFPVARIVWRSGARALSALMEDTKLKDSNVLIVDMSADTTHLISMRRGVFEQSVVPEGVATILARIAGGRMPDESLGHIRMLIRDACSSETCEAVEQAMAKAEPDLARIFGEAIGKMAATRHVPNDLILITHQDLEAWLGRFFMRIDFAQFTITTLPFEVHTPDSLGITTKILGEHQDPALAVDTILVNIEARS